MSRPVEKLYPLEVSDDNTDENIKVTETKKENTQIPDGKRSLRVAAQDAIEKIMSRSKSETRTVLERYRLLV